MTKLKVKLLPIEGGEVGGYLAMKDYNWDAVLEVEVLPKGGIMVQSDDLVANGCEPVLNGGTCIWGRYEVIKDL